MEYIVSALWISLESMALYYACRAFLSQKKNAKFVLLLLVLFGVANLSIRNPDIYPFSQSQYAIVITSFAACLLFSLFAFQGAWYSHIIVVTLWYFALSFIDTLTVYGTAAMLQISASDLVWRKWLYTVVVTVGKLFLLFLVWVSYYYRGRKEKRSLSGKRLFLITFFPIISIVMLCIVFDSYKTQEDLSINAVVFSVVLGVSNVAIIYWMNSLDRVSRAEQEIAILNQSMSLQAENFIALEKSYRAQRSATHEFKHQLQVLYDLLENGDSAAARDYISQLQIAHTSRMFAANTGHPIVDAILNEKYQVAKENSIDIQYKVNDLSALTISTNALVVLLSNLLDNAIEACQRYDGERIIKCTLLLEDELYLSIRNTSPPVDIINGEIPTTKDNKAEHGFGLAGVRRVLTQLHGEHAMNYDDHWFQFVAELPIG